MEEFEKKRMNQNILRKKGNPSRLSGEDVDDFLSTGLVDKDILKLIDPADFLSKYVSKYNAVIEIDEVRFLLIRMWDCLKL